MDDAINVVFQELMHTQNRDLFLKDCPEPLPAPANKAPSTLDDKGDGDRDAPVLRSVWELLNDTM